MSPRRRPPSSPTCRSSRRSKASAPSCSTRCGGSRPTSRTTASGCLREQTALVERATERLVEDLLPVLDSFDGALGSLAAPDSPEAEKVRDGVVGIRTQLVSVLEKVGLERIDATGAEFDPNEHEAVLQDDGDGDPHVARDPAHRLPAEGPRAAPRDGARHVATRGRETAMAPQREWFEKDYYAELGVSKDASEKDITKRVPQAREAVPPRRQPRRQRRRGALQGDLRRARRARRRREAQGVRPGPRDGRVRRRPRRSRRVRRRVRRVRRPGAAATRTSASRTSATWATSVGSSATCSAAAGRGRAAARTRVRSGPSAVRTSRPSCTSTSSTPSTASPRR